MALNQGMFANVGAVGLIAPTPSEGAIQEVLVYLSEAEKTLTVLTEQLAHHDMRLFGPQPVPTESSASEKVPDTGQFGGLVQAARRVRDAAYRADSAAQFIVRI